MFTIDTLEKDDLFTRGGSMIYHIKGFQPQEQIGAPSLYFDLVQII